MNDPEDTPTVIRGAREAAGLTQAELADQLGVSQPRVSHLETGHRQAGPRILNRLVDLYELLTGVRR